MKSSSKGYATLLIISLAASISCFIVKDASCMDPPQTPSNMPRPSVPEFSLRYVDHSYDVPETTISHTDPYTGNVTSQIRPAYHVKNFTIDVIIKNQNFPETFNGNRLLMKYYVQWKGNFEQEWKTLDDTYELDVDSKSGDTTFSKETQSITSGGIVDFQVKADLGYHTIAGSIMPMPYFMSTSSAWSNTQSIKLPDETSTQPTPASTIEPTAPKAETSHTYEPYILPLSAVTVVAVFGAGFFVYYFRKHHSV